MTGYFEFQFYCLIYTFFFLYCCGAVWSHYVANVTLWFHHERMAHLHLLLITVAEEAGFKVQIFQFNKVVCFCALYGRRGQQQGY